MNFSRRNFVGISAAALAGATAVSGRAQAASIPEAVIVKSPAMQPPVMPRDGQSYQPVVTLNGWTLPWRMNGDWKEFHLVAEPVIGVRFRHRRCLPSVSGGRLTVQDINYMLASPERPPFRFEELRP